MSSESASRKRSKWEETEEDEDVAIQVPPTKRRSKPKSVRTDHQRSASPPPQSPKAVSRPLHSVYVPPRTHHPFIQPSRSVYCYERLNQIEEGSYGIVFRARDKQTGEIVALKKLKLDEEKNGFPITALREIYALMSCRHENVVGIREVVVGDTLTQCVTLLAIPRSSIIITTSSFYKISQRPAQGVCGHGLYRTRPQDASEQHAVAVPPVRNQDLIDAVTLRCSSLSPKLDPSQGSEDEQFVDEQSGDYQGRRLWTGQTLWRPYWCRRVDPASGHPLVQVRRLQHS